MNELTCEQRNISLKAALRAAEGAVDHAASLGIRVVVSVVDRNGMPVATLRMAGAHLHSTAIAEDKAFTAASFGRDTAEWDALLATRSDALRQGLMQRPRFIAFGGGLVIRYADERIGGIGVSGGSEAQDVECAEAGLSAAGLMEE